MGPGQTSIQVLRSSRSSQSLANGVNGVSGASMLVAPSISYAPLGGGDAAAGPLLRARGPSGPSTTVVTVKKPIPVTSANVTTACSVANVTSVTSSVVSGASGGSSPIRRAGANPAATLISVPAAAGDTAGTGARVVKVGNVGTPVAASKARMASASSRLAQGGQASAQLRAVSLEYSHSDLTAATDNWSHSKRLGSGKHGAVYKAELKDGSQVAVKAIDLAAVTRAGDSPQDAGFDEEVLMLSKFRHPNLVTLLGWGSHGDFRYLVYELLAGGDLFRRLHKSRSSNPKPFLWYDRVSVCLDAASGLSHLHNSNPKAFHRDIKSANILMDRHGTAKLADFGLSCCSSYAGANHVDVRFASGTPGYRCPVYERTGRVSEASEAYSFCMVMLEVLLGLDPSATNSKAPSGLTYPIQEAVSPGTPGAEERCLQALDQTAGPWPLELAQEIARLAIRGVNATDEKQRPSSVEIVRTLRSLSERFPAGQDFTSIQTERKPEASSKHRATQPSVQKVQRSVAPQVPTPFPLREEAKAPLTPSHCESSQVSPVIYNLDSPYFLEVTLATGSFELSDEQRRLPLKPLRMEGGAFVVAVGRGQQPELFEAWLPDGKMRTCVSRNAFEVAWRDGDYSPWLTAQGSGPVALDGQAVTPKTAYSLRHGAEIGLLYGKQLLIRFKFHDNVKSQPGQVVRSYTGSLVPPTPVMGHRALPSSPYAYSARGTRRTRERSVGAAWVESGHVQVREAESGNANVNAPPVVCLEIWGEKVPENRIGPVSLAGKPLLVGSRHQPFLEKSLTNMVDRDHFCIASEGGVFWLLCLTSKGLWRVREGTEPQRLILDDLASLQHGDLIVPRLGPEVTVEQCCRTLSWNFLVVLEPS